MRSAALSPDDNSVASSESNISGLTKPVNVLSAMKGDGENRQTINQSEQLGFQPIHGMMSPTMSPPPMLMPTPIVGGSNPNRLVYYHFICIENVVYKCLFTFFTALHLL